MSQCAGGGGGPYQPSAGQILIESFESDYLTLTDKICEVNTGATRNGATLTSKMQSFLSMTSVFCKALTYKISRHMNDLVVGTTTLRTLFNQ